MIGRRKQVAAARPRAIVRRKHQVIGERPAANSERPQRIVRRADGGGVAPRGAASRVVERSRGAWLAVVLVVAFVGSLAAGGFWVARSPIFEVKRVEVAGTEKLDIHQIAEQADLFGDNMFTADLGGAQKRIYRLPLVANARVERKWPNTVVVHIEERKPWGTWEQSGVRYAIDREGVVLSSTGGPRTGPVIRSSEAGSRLEGDRVDYQAVEAAAEIYERLPQQLGTQVTEVAFVAGKGVQVKTADGQSALLGDSSAISYKLSVWAAMAKQAKTRGINYTSIDLRFGNRPVMQ